MSQEATPTTESEIRRLHLFWQWQTEHRKPSSDPYFEDPYFEDPYSRI